MAFWFLPSLLPKHEGNDMFVLKVVTLATHSSILAWKIPWTEEPGRLQFMGLQRVGHD